MRNVPCVAGCCGPMLSVIPSVSSSTFEPRVGRLRRDVRELLPIREHRHRRTALSRPRRRLGSEASPTASSLRLDRHGLDVDDAWPWFDHPGQQREVLAQRVALELGREVDVAQVGMAVEADAEHLVGLTFVPVGPGVDGDPRVDHERVVGDVGLHGHAHVAPRVGEAGEHLEPRFAAGVALFDLGAALRWRLGRVVLATAVRRRHPVERREEAEVVEPGRLQRRSRGAATNQWRRGSTGRRSA